MHSMMPSTGKYLGYSGGLIIITLVTSELCSFMFPSCCEQVLTKYLHQSHQDKILPCLFLKIILIQSSKQLRKYLSTRQVEQIRFFEVRIDQGEFGVLQVYTEIKQYWNLWIGEHVNGFEINTQPNKANVYSQSKRQSYLGLRNGLV